MSASIERATNNARHGSAVCYELILHKVGHFDFGFFNNCGIAPLILTLPSPNA